MSDQAAVCVKNKLTDAIAALRYLISSSSNLDITNARVT
jgi:hypothetical protein